MNFNNFSKKISAKLMYKLLDKIFLPEILASRKYIRTNIKLDKFQSIKGQIFMKINFKIFSQYFFQMNNQFIKNINHMKKPNLERNKLKKFQNQIASIQHLNKKKIYSSFSHIQ